MRFSMWGLMFLLASPTAIAAAKQQQGSKQQPAQQQQEDSLAAAARRAREHKKNEQGKKPKVWDNDNIPKTPGDVSVVGQSAPATAVVGNKSDESASEPPTAGNAPAQAKQKSVLEAELAAAKENLQTLQTDLDILQRKFALDQQTYYGKPDYSSDKDGAAALKDEQDQIDAKQQEMSDEQKKVADLQALLDAASTDNSNPAQ
ncbi:MAG TPA: hypothetical protein VNE63_23680 [Candidatus Acidoferrales bacterium]|nr:hypothetical protein [Candidatus Acidoferrales bacterium]